MNHSGNVQAHATTTESSRRRASKNPEQDQRIAEQQHVLRLSPPDREHQADRRAEDSGPGATIVAPVSGTGSIPPSKVASAMTGSVAKTTPITEISRETASPARSRRRSGRSRASASRPSCLIQTDRPGRHRRRDEQTKANCVPTIA